MRLALIELLHFYKRWISPLLPSACRFHPTCSDYMREAVERHGAARGVALGLRRLVKCHPLHPGGLDPVPTTSARSYRD
ncbi:MAG: membrane protein insertion efficiency factor YidD [Bryobacteraceae bacterium]|nr:membrane protein insertion efficiency factor YidD [Bryobacteraceae bacterium]